MTTTPARDVASPLLAFVAAVLLLNVGSWVIDHSGLEQQDGSWGYSFGAFMVSALYGGPVAIVLTLQCFAGLASRHDRRRGWAWGGAGTSAVTGIALSVLLLLWAAENLTSASVAAAALGVVTGGVLMVPLLAVARHAQTVGAAPSAEEQSAKEQGAEDPSVAQSLRNRT